MIESSFSGSKFDLLQECGEGGIEAIECALSTGRPLRLQRACGSKGPCIESRVEHGDLGAGRGDVISVAAWHAFDEAVEPEAAEVVGHGARPIRSGIAPLELCDVVAELPMPEARRGEREETERVHERVDAAVAEAKAGGALIVDEDGGHDGVQAVLADQAIVAQLFDAQEASVGGKADLPQGGQIAERATDLEIVRVVDGGFGPERLAFFVVLLDLGLLVLHVERGNDAFGQDARAKAAGGPARDASVEDQLHLVRTAEVEIFSDDFFEETAAGERPIEDLGQRKLCLQDREMVPIARSAVRGREGMREAPEPLAEDRVDLGRVERIGNPLHTGCFGA